MADKIKDAEDRFLESLMAADAIADDGFSQRIVRRIQRRLWLRRLTLPLAAAIGGVVAYRPIADLLQNLSGLVALLPADKVDLVGSALPQLQMLMMGGLLLFVGLVGSHLLQD